MTVVFGFPYVALGHRLGVVDVAPAAVMILTLLTRQRLYAKELLAKSAEHERAAMVDELTGLTSRRAFLARLDQELALPSAGNATVALLDLDGFKEINDRFGHPTGDDVLVAFSNVLREEAAGHVLARLGGDEFAIAAFTATAAEQVREVAHRVAKSHRIVTASSGAVSVACSTGLADSDDGARTDELMRRADLAMYAAKRSRGPRVTVFEQRLEDEASRKHLLVAELAGAADRDELTLAFQPLFRMSDGNLVAAEALLRWNHPTFGAVSPAEFIPLAEESGQIVSIGHWVTTAALQQLASWDRAGRILPRLLVNTSGRQIEDDGFVARIGAALRSVDVSPSRLTLEITETQLADLSVPDILQSIRTLGVRLAIDDFGSGYSNLARLSQLPVDILKIDREFVTGLKRPAGRLVLDAVVALARGLDVTTVAEGIETSAEAEVVRASGITWGQGFLLGRPVTAHELSALLPTAPAAAPRPACKLPHRASH
jgi:diguanylate cyclase (GGDEF)-like protein